MIKISMHSQNQYSLPRKLLKLNQYIVRLNIFIVLSNIKNEIYRQQNEEEKSFNY